MTLLDSLPKPDLDSRLVWARTRLCEFREGSISLEAAYFALGALVGWSQACPNVYEASQYMQIAKYYREEVDHDS